jgi:hypothetical protein
VRGFPRAGPNPLPLHGASAGYDKHSTGAHPTPWEPPGLLRSYAYASDRTVDPVAEDLISGRLAAPQLAEDAPSDR